MELWKSICLGDPEGGYKKIVSQMFWSTDRRTWLLIVYSANGKLLKIEQRNEG